MYLNILEEYVQNMTTYLHNKTGKPASYIENKVREFVRNNYKNPTVTIADKSKTEDPVVRDVPLTEYLGMVGNNILSPVGSIYTNTDIKQSSLSNMVVYKMDERNKIKKKMLEASRDGDEVLMRMYHSGQSSVKINTNSIIGAMGQDTNIFTNRHGFNSITGFARSMIAHAYTMAEQLLGGNFMITNNRDAINHITVLRRSLCKRNINVVELCNKYNIRIPSHAELKKFICDTISKYYIIDTTITEEYIDSLSIDDVIYIYYYQNMRHIVNDNTWIFDLFKRAMFSNDFNDGKLDLNNIDEDMAIVATIALGSELQDENGKYLSIYEWKDKDPSKVDKYCKLCYSMQSCLNEVREIMNVFLFAPTDTSNIHNKPKYVRNTTVVSDTDSVIFSTEYWVNLFNGGRDNIEDDDYTIAAFMTYWLTKMIFHNLEIFSLNHGSSESNKNKLIMKNEYLYPLFLYFNIKKTYAALMAYQEGVLFSKLKVDIKGGAIRSSTVCKQSRDYNTSFVVDKILKPASIGKLNVPSIISEIIMRENEIEKSILAGSTDYLKRVSIKHAREYKKPNTPPWTYWKFWDDVMSHKYGEIILSTKAPIVPIYAKLVTPAFLDELALSEPEMALKWRKYLVDNKMPNQLIVNPDMGVFPDEFKSLIIYNDIIYHNLAPIYLEVEQLNIGVRFKKKKILFRDVYL